MTITHEEHIPLAPYTWIKIGGPARYFFRATSPEELKEAQTFARQHKAPFLLLGGGSNMLIADKGFSGVVCLFKDTSIDFSETSVTVGAGHNLTRLAALAAERGLAGLEFAMGIPGTVGGAVRGNAGAFDGEMKDVVTAVHVLTWDGKIVERSVAELGFRYRHSVLKTRKEYVLSATLALTKGNSASIREKVRKHLAYRKERQPLEYPSLGSVFKNVPLKSFDADIQAEYALVEQAPRGLVPAGFLVDQLGLKGTMVGGAQISEKHGNFIINVGGATAEHVIMLMNLVEQKARTLFRGVRMEPEIQLVGFAKFGTLQS